jgi:hypothetical protein
MLFFGECNVILLTSHVTGCSVTTSDNNQSQPLISKITYGSLGNEAISTRSGGGGFSIFGATVLLTGLWSVTFNVADEQGGGFYLGSGDLTLAGGNVANNTAEKGGGLTVIGGTCYLNSGVLIKDNTLSAAGTGKQLDLRGGETVYVLPAPPGHYISDSICHVYRDACIIDPETGQANPECANARDACAIDANASAHNLPPSSSLPSGGYCPKASFVQPCNWRANPLQLGRPFHPLPLDPIDETYPYECAPGVLGSSIPTEQTGPTCAGLCPAGYFCAQPATWLQPATFADQRSPQLCPPGSFCQEGSAAKQNCPDGTFNLNSGSNSSHACEPCPRGSVSGETRTELSPVGCCRRF